ncbi:DUF4145 domain-containing protein [Pseudomonas syringae]|uniref:DUF4145 domain-containing protein n=2 Tax=Pseudomonas syringae TaxID=317 RepID=UPI003465A8C3
MAPKAHLRSYCNKCSGITKHDCLSEKNESQDVCTDEYEYSWSKTSRFIECRGCEEVTLRVDWWHSEYDASEDVDFYPPRISRQYPKWSTRLPRDWQSMLREIYAALHADSRRLAMMGARTIVDMYMNDTVGDVGGFAKKLNKLVSDGYLGRQDKDVLDTALEAGHAASHRGHLPTANDINHVMDIVENLLQKAALQGSAALLKKGTPSRTLVSSNKL